MRRLRIGRHTKRRSLALRAAQCRPPRVAAPGRSQRRQAGRLLRRRLHAAGGSTKWWVRVSPPSSSASRSWSPQRRCGSISETGRAAECSTTGGGREEKIESPRCYGATVDMDGERRRWPPDPLGGGDLGGRRLAARSRCPPPRSCASGWRTGNRRARMIRGRRPETPRRRRRDVRGGAPAMPGGSEAKGGGGGWRGSFRPRGGDTTAISFLNSSFFLHCFVNEVFRQRTALVAIYGRRQRPHAVGGSRRGSRRKWQKKKED